MEAKSREPEALMQWAIPKDRWSVVPWLWLLASCFGSRTKFSQHNEWRSRSCGVTRTL